MTLLLALLLAGEPAGPDYDALVARGIDLGRQGETAGATEAFDRAIALDPRRPEAWVERGGLRFLEKRYDDAVRDLGRALDLREDAYTRDLLASSLHLLGRSDEALACWNVLGQPSLRAIQIEGLAHTRDRVARRELSLAEGGLLDLDRLRESRLRLREVGVFDRVTLRPVPRGQGTADLEVALTERHGFAEGWTDFAVATGVNAAWGFFRLKYSNLAGSGVSFGGLYRWEEARPLASLSLEWPRPFGLATYLRLEGWRGRQSYDLDGPLRGRSRGFDLRLRRVLGARTAGHLRLRYRDRSFSEPRAYAPGGIVAGLEAGLERRLAETHLQRLDASVHVFQAASLFGSELEYPRRELTLRYQLMLSPPEDVPLERSVLAARLRWGWGSANMPLDDMFAPGTSADMDLPLRAHVQAEDGVLGHGPISRSIALLNLEWRRRFFRRPGAQAGVVLFYDGARITRRATGPDDTLHDLGCGLRIGFAGTLLRIDYGHGRSDGKNALSIGVGQVF